MSLGINRLAAILVAIVIVSSLVFARRGPRPVEATDGMLDLFTQKEPHSGRGINVSSEAFGQEEIVILYALAACDDSPVENALVAFDILTPANASFSLSASANSSGIATISFAVSMPPLNISESEILGKWFVQANAIVYGQLLSDTLAFEVDYIVQLVSVRTVDQNLQEQSNYAKGSDVGLEIALRNIAMIAKEAMLSVTVQDEVGVPISSFAIGPFEVQANRKTAFLYCKFQFSKWAFLGQATVHVSALQAPVGEGGTPFCPPISTTFMILPVQPTTVDFRDVAVVSVVSSAQSVRRGQFANVSVIVQNEGTTTESFNTSAYCGDVFLGTAETPDLPPYTHATLSFAVNSSLLSIGNYTVRALIPQLGNESDTTDNLFVDGQITVWPFVIVHDIAVTDVSVSEKSIYIGEPVHINASIANKGTVFESFDVTILGNLSTIGPLEVSSLGPEDAVTLAYVWNTSLASEGFYQISAFAQLLGDINPSDNKLIDGVVEVKRESVPPTLTHDVALTNIKVSHVMAFVGEVIDIHATVRNEGNFTESFDVAIFGNSTALATRRVEGLESGAERILGFSWNTTHASIGNYTISAIADSVPEEENLANNHFADGVVEIVASPKGWAIPDWFFWLSVPLFLILLLALLLILFRRRREQSDFYSGWTAWYYRYDLRSRALGVHGRTRE